MTVNINSTQKSALLHLLEQQTDFDVTQWHGQLDEEAATNLLQKQPAYTYVLRQCPKSKELYLSFTQTDFSVKHQPITYLKDEWFFRNGDAHRSASLFILVAEAMHCNLSECKPLASRSK